MRTLLTLSSPRHHGPITTLTLDRKQAWLITGTAMGTLTLWDLRFGLRLRSWKVGLASKPANEGGADYVRINQCVVHPTKGKGRWIIVGCEARAKDGATVVMEVWDIEKMAIIETFMVQEGGAEVSAESSTTPRATPAAGEILVVPELGGKEEVKSPAEAIAALVKARMAEKSATNGKEEAEKKESEEDDVFIPDPAANLSLHPLHDIRSLLTGSDFGGLGSLYVARGGHLDAVYPTTLSSTEKPGAKGYLISGGEDRKIRLWDLAKVERSLVVSGLEGEGERPSFKCVHLTLHLSLTSLSYARLFARRRTLRTPTETSSYIESTPSTSTSLLSLQPAHRTSLITSHQQQLLKAHRDCITALACIDAPFRCGIVSGDRSGVLKVFRVEVE
jgi:phosphoinositide-3-kinase regulatory subunit 4